MAKQYRPLDAFNEDVEDKELEQLSGFNFNLDLSGLESRSIKAEPLISPADIPVKDEQEALALSSVLNSQKSAAIEAYSMSNPYNPLISDEFFTSAGLQYDPINEPSDSENFWNLTFNTANSIHIESLEGQKRVYQMELAELEEQGVDKNSSEYQDKLEQIQEQDKEIEEAYKNLEESKQASPLYQMKALAGQKAEGTGMMDYLGSAESAQDLGGALSDIKWMTAGIALGATAAYAPAASAAVGGGPAGMILGGLMLGVGIVGGIATQYQMRDNESLAEMESAYKERYNTLVENFKIDNNGEEPSPEQLKEIDALANQGLYQMYRQNMMLTGSDIAQIAIPLIPMGGLLRTARVPFMASKWAKTGMHLGKLGAIMGAEAALEGFEEAYQYTTKEQYKLGMFDKFEDTDYPWMRSMLNTAYIGDRAIEGMVDMYMHRSTGGLTNTEEFRNSTRAGMALGFFMGGAMGLTVSPAIEKSADITNRYVLKDELKALGASFSNASWEELLDVEQASNKVDAIADALEKNGGKNILRAFRLFKEDQEKVGNPNEIDFDKVEKSLRTSINLYKAFKNKSPNLAVNELKNIVKGYELLSLYMDKAKEKENQSVKSRDDIQQTEAYTAAFSESTNSLKRAYNLNLEIKALEELLKSNKEGIEQAKKLNRYSKTDLEKHMLDNTKVLLEKALNLKKSVLDAEREANEDIIGELDNISSVAEDKLIDFAKGYIGSEVMYDYLQSLRAPLANPKEGFNLKNHPFVRDIAATEERKKEAAEDREKNKKEEEESVQVDDSEVEVGDKAWFQGMPFEYMGKKGEQYILKPLSKTGGALINVGRAIFEGLRKLVRKEDYEREVIEVVNEDFNNNNETEEAKEGRESAENIKNNKERNKKAKEEKENEEEDSIDPNAEPVVGKGQQFTLFKDAIKDAVYRFFPNINFGKYEPAEGKLTKEYLFFHERSADEIENLDVTYEPNLSSLDKLDSNPRGILRKNSANLVEFLQNPDNRKIAEDVLKNLEIKVLLKDAKGQIRVYLFNANQQALDSNEEFLNMTEAFGRILSAYYTDIKGTIKGKIAHANYGEFNNLRDENGVRVKNKIPEVFKDRFNKDDLLFAWQNDEQRVYVGDQEITTGDMSRGGKPGGIYLLYKHKVEGQTVFGTLLSLNTRQLNNQESSILFDVYKKLVFSKVNTDTQFRPGDTYENGNLFENIKAKQLIEFLIPRLEGVRINEIYSKEQATGGLSSEENGRMVYVEQQLKEDPTSLNDLNGIKYHSEKGEETRLYFGLNYLSQNTAMVFSPDFTSFFTYAFQGDNAYKTTYELDNEGNFNESFKDVEITKEKALKEIEDQFNVFAQKNIYHQVKGNLLNYSIFDDKKFAGFDDITLFGKKYNRGDRQGSLYSNILVEGENPVITTDVKAVGRNDETKRIQINRQVVIDPSTVNLESKKADKKPKPKPTPESKKKEAEQKAQKQATDTTQAEEKKEPTTEEPPTTDPNEIKKGTKSFKSRGSNEIEFMVTDAEVDATQPFINIEEARAYLKKVLGTRVRVDVEEGLLRVGTQGRQAYASFVDNVITLSTMGRRSSEYHEAEHAIERLYLTKEEIRDLDKETADKYGEPTPEDIEFIMKERGFDKVQARSYLLADKRAEEYRNYELDRANIEGLGPKLTFWIQTLKDYIVQIFKGLHSRRLYYKISQGDYARDKTTLFKEDTQKIQKVKELFDSNPELAKIGTAQQYAQYLDSVFPDSKVKDIVYHGTPDGRFDSFDINQAGKNTKQSTKGIYFTDSKKTADFYAEGSIDFSQFESLEEYKAVTTAKVFPAVLNAKNLEIVDTPQVQYKKGDAILRTKNKLSDKGLVGDLDFAHQYIVFKPEQIHILGNNEDIERFKKWKKSNPNVSTLFKEENPVSLSTSPQVQALEEAGFNSVDIYNISKSLLYAFLNEAVTDINENNNTDLVFIRDFGDIQTYLTKESVEDILNRIYEKVNDLQKENIEIIRQNIDLFIREEDDIVQGTMVDILKATRVSLNTEEEYKDAVDSNDDLKSIKSPFEFSSLDSATMATRLLFEMIPLKTENGERVRDPRTGLSILADGSYIYNKLQETLSDIDHIYNDQGQFVAAIDQMKQKIEELALSIPVFQGFNTNLLDKLTEQQLSQFFRVMNMKNYNFRALITSSSVKSKRQEDGTIKDETTKYVRFINAAAQSLVYRTKEIWVENSKMKFFAYNEDNKGIIKNLEEFKNLLIKFEEFKEEYGKVKGFPEKPNEDRSIERNEYIEQYSKDLSAFLKEIGIEISPRGIFKHIITHPQGHVNAINNINTGEKQNPGIFNMFKSKKEDDITFYKINQSIDPETLVINLKGFNLDSSTPLEDFSSPLTYLAKIASTAEDSLLSTTTSAAGKQFWNYSLGNYLFNTSTRFKNSVYEIKSRLQDRWSDKSFYLKELLTFDPVTKQDTIKKALEILTFAESRDRDSNKGGKTYKDLGDREFIVDSINKTLGNTEEGVINFPTFADKSVWYMMRGATLLDFKTSDFIQYDKESGLVKINSNSQDVKKLTNIFGGYIINEVDRIIQVQNDLETLEDDQLTVSYHYTEEDANGRPDRTSGNGLKILLFPSLNNDEILNKVGLKQGEKWLEHKKMDSAKEALAPYIVKAVEDIINKDLTKAAENNVINFKNGTYSFIKGKFDPISSKIRGAYNQDPVQMMANFTINSIIANVEATKIFSGDIAYYKNYEDLTKRIVAIIAPGSSLNLTGPSFYRAAVVKDYTLNSASLIKNYVAYLEKSLGYSKEAAEKLVSPYGDVNVTDGQAYITLERWRDIMIGLGDIDKAVIEDAYERLNDPKGKPTPEDVALVMAQPLKGMLFSRRDSEIHGKAEQIPTYLKYSQAVLIPAFVENKADIGELLKAMKRDKVDEVIFESGIKTGALRPTQIVDENGKLLNSENIKFNVMRLDNRDWKLQQPLKPHESNEQLEGSQVKKNILSGIKLLENYSVPYSYYDKKDKKWKSSTRKIKGYELVEEFHEVDRALSDYEFSKLSEEWGLKWNQEEQRYSIENMDKLQESLVKDFKADDNIPEKVIQLLNLKTVNKGNTTIKEFAIAFDNNPFDDVIERKISSIITKRLIKLNMPGGSYIQTSAFGMTKPQRFTDLTKAEQTELREQLFPYDRLDAAMWDQKTGKAKGAQIFLPNYMKKFIPNNVFNNKAELSKYLKDNRLLEAIGYRIPNQGLSSIDALEVVGFLPQGYGDTIIAYDEITAKTGSDFDIDKMYVMLPSFDYVYEKDAQGNRVKKDGKDVIKGVKYINFDASKGNILEDIAANKGNKNYIKALKNRKLELYRAILQDENTFGELINPLDSMDVKNDAALVRFLEAKKDLLPEDIKKVESLYSIENGEFSFDKKFYKTVNSILSKNVQDLEWFGFYKQVEIRDIYLGGKFGVGQEARHMVDHAISQHSPNWRQNDLESPYYFSGIDLGVGNITPFGSSDLSQVYVEGKGKQVAIASILSARLDAYVDIAKDPYIFYINNNYLTANTVALLDRMGVNPQWTDLFTSLPIIKEYVKVTKNINAGNNPVIGDTKYFKAEEYLTARLQQGINDLLPEEYKKENLEDIRPYNLTKNKSRVKALARKGIEVEEGTRVKVTDIYTIEDLANMIDSKAGIPTVNDLYNQLALFKYFMELKSKATILNKAVTASKYDTQGARGGFSQGMIFEGLMDELTSPSSPLAGFQERFERTMAGKFKEHGPDLLRQVFGEMFLLGNENYRNTLRRIGVAVGHSEDIVTNEEYIRDVHRNFRSFMYTETDYYKSIDIKGLLYGKDNIMARLSKAKQDDSSIKNNLLIKYLAPVGPSENNGFVYVKAPARIAKTGNEKNALTNAWDALLKSPDAQIRKLGEDLYKFSIISSGFKNGTFTFHELVPLDYEMETGIYDQFGKIAEYVKDQGYLDIDLMTRFMISQMNNTDIVPEVDGKINPIKVAAKDRKTVLVLEIKNDFSYKYQAKPLVKEDGIIVQYPEYVPFVTMVEGYDNKRSLYKFEGLKEGKSDKGKTVFTPVYSMVQRYNFEAKGLKIYEPIDLSRESVLNENKKKLIIKVVEDGSSRKSRTIIGNYFSSEEAGIKKAKEAIQELVKNTVSITSDEIFDTNAEFFGIAPWSNNLTTAPNVQETVEKVSIYPGEILKPDYTLENPIVVYLDSKLQKFSSIQKALDNGVSLNDAVQLAAKYNLEIQNEIQDLSDDMSYLESFDNNYEIPGYGMAVKRAKMLLDANVIGFQEVSNPEGEPVYVNTRPIYLFLEELSNTIEESDYLQVIKDMVNPKIENTDYQVVTFATPNNQFGGMYSEVRNNNRLEGSTLLMSESTSEKTNAVTLLHEVLHAFTNNELTKDSKLYKKSKALYELWYSKFKNAKNMPEPLRKYINEYEQDKNNTEKEQLVIKEFVSYGLTDSSMVTQLKSIEVNAKTAAPESQLSLFTEKIESAFNKLVEVVLSTFNITDKNTDTNAYELLKDSVGEFISQASNLRDSKEYREETILSILADNSEQFANIKKSIREKSSILKQLNENIKKECR